MKRYLISLIALVTLVLVGCSGPASSITPAVTQPVSTSPASTLPASLDEKGNFKFLVSDEKNAIDDFTSLFITISSIGVHKGAASENVSDNASDNWIEIVPAITKVDLKQLIGDNATSVWSGNITPGTYNKVFINISDVSGTLATATDNQSTSVKLPGGKLQISKPFTISATTPTSFVFDVTVVAAGNENKNVKYILKPQIDMSGSDQKFKEVKPVAEKGNNQNALGLRLSLDGKAEAGAQVTLLASSGKSGIEGAVITLNGKDLGKTNNLGQLALTLPTAPGEIQIKAVSGNMTAELKLNLKEKGKG